jgi:hypothetical protein
VLRRTRGGIKDSDRIFADPSLLIITTPAVWKKGTHTRAACARLWRFAALHVRARRPDSKQMVARAYDREDLKPNTPTGRVRK